MNNKKYDIIGDIHGCSQTLVALLEKLGYRKEDGIYRHSSRKAIFLGDFIDRGPYQRDVIEIVRSMIETGAALSVMGNHEYNAISYFTKDNETSDYLRKHSDKNNRQHEAFLEAYADSPDKYEDVVSWFKTFPLWLEIDGLRVVHACWDSGWIEKI